MPLLFVFPSMNIDEINGTVQLIPSKKNIRLELNRRSDVNSIPDTLPGITGKLVPAHV